MKVEWGKSREREIHIIAVDPVLTDMVPCNTHWHRLLVVVDGSERVKYTCKYIRLKMYLSAIQVHVLEIWKCT